MKKRSLTLLAISGLVLVMAAPLPAQTMRLTASIPFEFVTGTSTLPAGDYVVDATALNGVVRVSNENTHDGSAVLTNSARERIAGTSPEVRLVFHRYGNQYFLAQMWDTGAGREIPMSKAERAIAETAASRTPENLVILARR